MKWILYFLMLNDDGQSSWQVVPGVDPFDSITECVAYEGEVVTTSDSQVFKCAPIVPDGDGEDQAPGAGE